MLNFNVFNVQNGCSLLSTQFLLGVHPQWGAHDTNALISKNISYMYKIYLVHSNAIFLDVKQVAGKKLGGQLWCKLLIQVI